MNETREEQARGRDIERQENCPHFLIERQPKHGVKQCVSCGQIWNIEQNLTSPKQSPRHNIK